VFDDESKLRYLYGKHLGAEIDGVSLGEDLKGYKLKITGGNDKEGFGMKQGVFTHGRVKLLMAPRDIGFRGYSRRLGERRRKSVRGCIVSSDIAALNLIIVKQGETPIVGLSENSIPRHRGPKRASKIRKLFHLTKNENIIGYSTLLCRKVEKSTESGTEKKKSLKIQRLVTPLTLQRNMSRFTAKKKRLEKSLNEARLFHRQLVQHLKEKSSKKIDSTQTQMMF
jgi:small subunit ribosomal protein S6e